MIKRSFRLGVLCVALCSAAAAGCARDKQDELASGGGGGTGGAAGAGGSSGEYTGEPRSLRVATFNVRNLFNDERDAESFVFDEEVVSSGEYQNKLAEVARVLAPLNADVIVLQEIENEAVLGDLAARAELGRTYAHTVTFPGNDPRGIDVAMLSTLPVLRRNTHKNDLFSRKDDPGGEKYQFARDCVEVDVRFNGVTITLLGIHFKSKSNDNPDKRLAEAQHTRFIADALSERDPTAGVLIVGDFNDYPGTPPMDAIDDGTTGTFTSAGRMLPESDAWTVESSSTASGLALHDDVIANGVLGPMMDSESVEILHDDEIDSDLRGTSDHAPVAVTFTVEPVE